MMGNSAPWMIPVGAERVWAEAPEIVTMAGTAMVLNSAMSLTAPAIHSCRSIVTITIPVPTTPAMKTVMPVLITPIPPPAMTVIPAHWAIPAAAGLATEDQRRIVMTAIPALTTPAIRQGVV